jgi:hypothetical protein
MKKIKLTEGDCTFVHHVLQRYAALTEGLDGEDKVEIKKLADKFR